MKVKFTTSGREYHAETWSTITNNSFKANNVTVYCPDNSIIYLKNIILHEQFIEAEGEISPTTNKDDQK